MSRRQGWAGKIRQLLIEAAGTAIIAIILTEIDKRQRASRSSAGASARHDNVERPAERLAGSPGAVAPRHDHGDSGEERMPLVSDAPAGATLDELARLNGVSIDKPARA